MASIQSGPLDLRSRGQRSSARHLKAVEALHDRSVYPCMSWLITAICHKILLLNRNQPLPKLLAQILFRSGHIGLQISIGDCLDMIQAVTSVPVLNMFCPCLSSPR